MWLMIFVNDLWTLVSYPKWLGHATANEDYLGLADVVFPAFLFIVGLSIPHAINARIRRGDKYFDILQHIGLRSFALIVMGFMMVNLENMNTALTPLDKPVWMFLMALSFVLIWNKYGEDKSKRTIPVWIFKATGWVLLLFLTWTYVGGEGAEAKPLQPYWWGILGLIGWAYLLNAIVYLLTKGNLYVIGVLVIVFFVLNINEVTEFMGFNVNLVVGASNHVSVMLGVLISSLLTLNAGKIFIIRSILLAVILINLGFILRPEWGISKIGATPSWTMICGGISILSFIIIRLVTDINGKTSWARFIKPAGSSTLTCYLIPYFYYALLAITALYLPEFLRSGYIGILKSILFGLLIIKITGLLEKTGIKLKI